MQASIQSSSLSYEDLILESASDAFLRSHLDKVKALVEHSHPTSANNAPTYTQQRLCESDKDSVAFRLDVRPLLPLHARPYHYTTLEDTLADIEVRRPGRRLKHRVQA